MIKVCHMTSAHESDDVRIFKKECVSLASKGYEVFLVSEGTTREDSGVHVVGLGKLPQSRINRIFKFSKKVYQRALDLDCEIYHIHDPELLMYALRLKKRGKKVIFDSHEKYSSQLKNKPYLPKVIAYIISGFYSIFENFVLSRIDGLIFPCLQDGKHPFEGKCKHIATVNNLPLLSEMYDQHKENCEKIKRSVVYIGNISHNRGITHLIKGAYKANAKVLLGGDFCSREYEDSLKASKEFECVLYLGKLDRRQVLDTLEKSEIGMATLLNVGQYNQYDNLATKVYEYMSLGIPVVLSNSKFNNQIVNEYRFGICVEPDNPDEIANAIQYLLAHPNEAKEMGAYGRKAVKDIFNWEREQNNLFELYRVVLDEG